MNRVNDHAACARIVRIDAAAAVDGAGFFAAPASLLLQIERSPRPSSSAHVRVLASGRSDDVARHEAAQAPGTLVLAQPDRILIPGLVNAHTHLDLTHLGPIPHDPVAGFVAWVDQIRAGRYTDDIRVADSVRRGIALSLSSGTVLIGDIAGAPASRPTLAPWRVMRELGVRGVSYLEFFAMGKGRERGFSAIRAAIDAAAQESADRPGSARIGVQPHAPNTVALPIYLAAIEYARLALGPDVSIATHLAETPEELDFVAHARGPQREMLERLGVWDDTILEHIGRCLHPVEHLKPVLSAGASRMAAVHINAADDRAIEILAATQTRVVYCPHASEYFAAERQFGPHRYRDMLAAGVPVALGTDSIASLPTGHNLSVLEEMRRLHRRDHADPLILLRMATIHGAAALGVDGAAVQLQSGAAPAGLLAVPIISKSADVSTPTGAAAAVCQTPAPPELLFADTDCGLAGLLGRRLPV